MLGSDHLRRAVRFDSCRMTALLYHVLLGGMSIRFNCQCLSVGIRLPAGNVRSFLRATTWIPQWSTPKYCRS
jgi:hypothetical protein